MNKLTADDVLYLGREKYGLRVVLHPDIMKSHFRGVHTGDVHCLSATHLLAGTDSEFVDAKAIVEANPGAAAKELEKRIETIVHNAFKDGSSYEGRSLWIMLVRDCKNVDQPYEVDPRIYPMGKAGRQEIAPSQIVSVISPLEAVNGKEAVMDRLASEIGKLRQNGGQPLPGVEAARLSIDSIYTPETKMHLSRVAQAFIDGTVDPLHKAEETERFARNLKTTMKEDPAFAVILCQSILNNEKAGELRAIAGEQMPAAFRRFMDKDPVRAKSYANVMLEREHINPVVRKIVLAAGGMKTQPAVTAPAISK